MKISETCRAKLNLFLDVTGRRPDGFHDLLTVFHEVDLADDLEVAVAAGTGPVTIEVEPRTVDVPADKRNLAVRAAAAVLDTFAPEPGSHPGIALRLTKRIPVGSGLGGGSADAAGALRAVPAALGRTMSADDLRAIALRIGSDIPFLVEGGSALARGRGEVLERVPSRPIEFVLLVPTFPLATADVYRALPHDLPPRRDPRAVLDALAAGDADALGRACSNALLDGARRVDPRIDEVLAAARAAAGPRVHLTGSGSTCFVPLRADEPAPDLRSVPHLREVVRTRSRA